jgi:hypothetical protein
MLDLMSFRNGLPERFSLTVDKLLSQLPRLFDINWPLVPHHTDLLENNIHVNKETGHIAGICDWRDTFRHIARRSGDHAWDSDLNLGLIPIITICDWTNGLPNMSAIERIKHNYFIENLLYLADCGNQTGSYY